MDLERIERDVDIEALQRHLEMLTYGDLSKAGTGDATFLKIFRLSQLMIEYLLNVQDILAEGLEQVSTSCKEAKRHRDKYREKTRVQDEKIKALRSQLKARRQTAQAYSGLVLREANAPPRHWRDDPPAPRRSYDDDAPAPRRARTPDDYESSRNESGEMTVYVSAADGTTARHTVGEVSTARELRSKLGAPGRLVFRGNELTPDVVLADAGVRHGDTILIVHREGVDRDARDQRHDLDQRIATLESSIKGEMAVQVQTQLAALRGSLDPFGAPSASATWAAGSVQPAPGCLAGALEDDDGDDDAFASAPRSTVAPGPPRTPHAAEAPADVTQLRAMEERLKAQMDALEEKMLGLARQPREPTPAKPREPTPSKDPTPRKPATPPPRDPTPQPTPQPTPETSWTLRCAVASDDFPEPVRPQTPTRSPPAMVREMPSKTVGRFGRYRMETFSSVTRPAVGQLRSAGATSATLPVDLASSPQSSGATSAIARHRSRDVACCSASATPRTHQLRIPETAAANESMRPTRPASKDEPMPSRPSTRSTQNNATRPTSAAPIASRRMPIHRFAPLFLSQQAAQSSIVASVCAARRSSDRKARIVTRPSMEEAKPE